MLKHMTCGDVNEGGVKRLLKVPGCRCLRRDDDVGAVVFGMNKAHKNQNPNTHVNARKFGAKMTHKSCQIDVKGVIWC
jgi:ribosomal protein L25 (general stress protein Ctc)